MVQVIISLFINIILTMSVFNHPELPADITGITGTILLIFWVTSLTGTIAYSMTKKRGFATAALIGFAIFVPIGLIGAYGVRKIMDEEERKIFYNNREQTE